MLDGTIVTITSINLELLHYIISRSERRLQVGGQKSLMLSITHLEEVMRVDADERTERKQYLHCVDILASTRAYELRM